MQISSSNIKYHEIIGLNVNVLESNDKTLIGLLGRIINETKNMLEIRDENRIRLIPKKEVKLQISLPNKNCVSFDGKDIAFRSEDRIGKMRRVF